MRTRLLTKAVSIVALAVALVVPLATPTSAAPTAGSCTVNKPIVISSAKVNTQGCTLQLDWDCPVGCTLQVYATITGTGFVGMTVSAFGFTGSCTAGPTANATCEASVAATGVLGGGFSQATCGPIETTALLVEFRCGLRILSG